MSSDIPMPSSEASLDASWIQERAHAAVAAQRKQFDEAMATYLADVQANAQQIPV